MSQVLRETDTPQTSGSFIKFDVDGEIESKCAMGILACGSPEQSFHLDKENQNVFGRFTELFESYGLEDIRLPYLHQNHLGIEAFDWEYTYEGELITLHLSEIIIRLNDSYRLTFEQIAEFLEVTLDY